MLSAILSCHNIEESIAFYEKLGFIKNWAMEDENGISFASVSMFDAEILLGVIDFVEEKNRKKLGIRIQLYIEIPRDIHIDDLYTSAIEHNVKIVKPPADRDWGERVFVINDLDGYNIMFAQKITSA